jgi:hypothetical protein
MLDVFTCLIMTVVLLILLNALWSFFPLPARKDLIPGDYFELRRRFLEQASVSDSKLESHLLAARGPAGEDLYIDTLWFGNSSPQRMFLHISGTHGVEGYCGSAIQSRIIEKEENRTMLNNLPDDAAVVFLHGYNPWGMSHLRRFNESNVDLNRNFVLNERAFSGAPESYRKIEWFLNPKGEPSRLDLFFPQVVYLIARYGFKNLKQAVTAGQYEYAGGIYFGGTKLEESSIFLKGWVEKHLIDLKELYVLEVHTGLGEPGRDLLFWPCPSDDPKTLKLQQLLREKFDCDNGEVGRGLKTTGDLQKEVPKLIPNTDVYWVLQEFGAYQPLRTLRSIRNENRYYQYTDNPSSTHWSKRELLETFCPGSRWWQEKVLRRGLELAEKFIKML